MSHSTLPIAAKIKTEGAARVRTRGFRFHPAHLFVLPYALGMLAFGVGPGLYALLISFASFTEGRPQWFQAGLANYFKAYGDFRFLSAFRHVGNYLLISLPALLLGIVGLAILLHMRPGKLASLLRTIYFIPGAVSGPALVLLAIFMFDPNISVFRPLLRLLGFGLINDVIQPPALPTLFTITTFFAGAGGWIAILYGALDSISTEVIEAATIDGCNAWQKALHIKLPLVRPYILYMMIMMFAGNVQLFAEPQLMAAAGGNVPANWSPNQLGYTYAFTLGNFGGSAAISLVLLVIGVMAAYAIVRWTGVFRFD